MSQLDIARRIVDYRRNPKDTTRPLQIIRRIVDYRRNPNGLEVRLQGLHTTKPLQVIRTLKQRELGTDLIYNLTQETIQKLDDLVYSHIHTVKTVVVVALHDFY